MNTLTNIKQRVKAAYKTRPRQTRAAKLRGLRREAEESLRADTLTSASSISSIGVTDSDMESDQGHISQQAQADEVNPVQENHDHDIQSDRTTLVEEDAPLPVENDSWSPEPPTLSRSQTPNQEYELPDDESEDTYHVDEQALRDKAYVFSLGEEPDDYTNGPVRQVIATDGVKQCAALLLAYEFSGSVQKAVRAQREFMKAKRVAARQIEVNLHFEATLIGEIANHNSRLPHLEHDDSVDPAEVAALKEELYVLEEMLKNAGYEEQHIKSGLESQAMILREIQARTNAYLEEAFVFARLIDPEEDEADTPVEERDLQEEYQDFRQALGLASTGSVVPLDTNSDHLRVPIEPLTEEQAEEQRLIDAVWSAYERLQSAQAAFDNRGFHKAAERQANHEAIAYGEHAADATPENFDLRWLKRDQEITHELIEAETALSEAKAAAVHAGVDVPMDDRASGFVDDVADGYRMSLEQERIASVPSPRVKNWLSEIPDVASPSFNERFEEGDEWEAEDVEISDSVSLVAEGAERKRIDKWRQVCGLEFASGA